MSKQIQVNDFVKWTSEDKDGKFSHVGQVVSMNEKAYVINFSFGQATIPTTDGTVVKTNATKLEKHVVEKDTTPVEPEVKRERSKPSKDGPSKQDQVIEIVKSNPDASRKDLIELVVKQLGMTPAGASTYVYNAKKALSK